MLVFFFIQKEKASVHEAHASNGIYAYGFLYIKVILNINMYLSNCF